MLKSLPFDQPVTVISLEARSAPNKQQFTVKPVSALVDVKPMMSQYVWPVLGPNSAAIVMEKTTKVDDMEQVGKLERLKVAALIAIISQHVFCFFCAESGQCVNQLMNQTEFDFQSALLKQSVYERELANYRKIAHCNLVAMFKTILERLMEKFYAANELRYDQMVLSFAANIDMKDINPQFSYSDHQLMLAKQYVYSALYDGQLLQFDSTSLNLLCAKLNSQNEFQTTEPEEKLASTTFEKTIQQVKEKTSQIFQRYKLFNKLVQNCQQQGDQDTAPIFAQLSSLCNNNNNVWDVLKTSPLEYERATSFEKARIICSKAFEGQSEDFLIQLDDAGFFQDADLFIQLMDQGCFDNIKTNIIRRMLLEKALQLDVSNLLTSADRKRSFKRALWLISLCVEKLSKKDQIDFTVTSMENGNNNSTILLTRIYDWLKKNDDQKQFVSHKKKIDSFLLRMKQYNLLRLD